jgi:hypothetical protein
MKKISNYLKQSGTPSGRIMKILKNMHSNFPNYSSIQDDHWKKIHPFDKEDKGYFIRFDKHLTPEVQKYIKSLDKNVEFENNYVFLKK